ncbi:MAG: dehydrogenase [Blastopirellula sp.]|nr:MAG: dehydrogenase [Blastopirellula sp.]
MSRKTRRQFLEDSMMASAAAVTATGASSLFAAEEAPQSKSPNEKLSVAVVGVKGRGGSHIGAFAGRKDTEITYVCDVDTSYGESRATQIEKRQGRKPKFVQDIRRVLEDPTVDIVTIATPNHWHALAAIWSIQAGKDVYVEKPVSHNVSEGRRIVEAARKYNKICQTGTQSRSNPGMIAAMDYVHSGKIGHCKVARGLCYKARKSIGELGTYDPPKTVDHNLWTGPAPMGPVTRPQFHYDWHWQRDFGNGDLGNQGIHQMDLARWGLGVNQLSNTIISYGGRYAYNDAGDTANTQMVLHDFGDRALVFEVRGLVYDKNLKESSKKYKGSRVGVIFEGTEGYVVMTSYSSGAAFDLEGNKVKEFKGGADHFQNFLDAVRSRDKNDLNADIEDGHLSSALCHLGNISYYSGDRVSQGECLERLQDIETTEDVAATLDRFASHLTDNKVNLAKEKIQLGPLLKFNPKSETFIGNAAADVMLTREYRAPFIVPAAGKV